MNTTDTLSKIPTRSERDLQVLQAAWKAWQSASELRNRRTRSKRFAYGDQWFDMDDYDEGDYANPGEQKRMRMTNNLIRQLVKTVVGRFRSQRVDEIAQLSGAMARHYSANQLEELDSRALEEFLISGCCVQRIEPSVRGLVNRTVEVDNVNLNHFFINTMLDGRGRDTELVGELHDLNVSDLIKRLSGGSRRKAAWLRALYSAQSEERIDECRANLGADSQQGVGFWRSDNGKCRAIEVWTLESREVLVCHDVKWANMFTVPYSELSQVRHMPEMSYRWDIAEVWHCRWFTPMGDLLASYDSPYNHRRHPFAVKMYPLTDGEVHSLVEDVIGQQKYINHLLTLSNRILHSSAKGVLLYPVSALPEGFTWNDVRKVWSNCNGILPFDPRQGEQEPKQIMSSGHNAGTVEMATLQMKIFDYVSGVSAVLQGRAEKSGNSASLHEQQVATADVALTDIYRTFRLFLDYRDQMMLTGELK